MSALSEGQRLGAYRIVRLLGEGGMGAVYEARQESLDRRVALKTLHAEFAQDQEFIARFFNEAKVLSQLAHPSIVQVSDFGKAADGSAYLVMEYLRGQSLGRRLRELCDRGERLPTLTALQLGFQIADVLAVAHSQGIVHRDIKPENLMLVADPIAPGGERVKLLDFGIAKLTNEHDKGGVKTGTQQVMGTPAYMSPEQCAGAGGVDAKTDVYALGCVLYEALAGRPPFVAEGTGQLIGMHLFQAPPLLPSLATKVPQNVSALVHRLLIKDKAQRLSMTEAADELAKLLSKQTGGGPVVRSRSPLATEPDAMSAPTIVPLATTGGMSTGQRVGGHGRSRLLVAGGAVLATGVGLLLMTKISTRSTSHPGESRSANPTAAAAPSAQTTYVPTPTALTGQSPASVVAPPTPDKPREIHWKIGSTPTDGLVVDEGGRILGVTPLELPRTSAPGVQQLRVHKPGYVDAKLSLHRDQSEDQQVVLVPSARGTAAKLPGQPAANKRPVKGSIGYEP